MLPEEERLLFRRTLRDAVSLARSGRVEEGWRALDLGLVWAETPALCPLTFVAAPPDAWTEELVRYYRRAIVWYSERFRNSEVAAVLKRLRAVRECRDKVRAPHGAANPAQKPGDGAWWTELPSLLQDGARRADSPALSRSQLVQEECRLVQEECRLLREECESVRTESRKAQDNSRITREAVRETMAASHRARTERKRVLSLEQEVPERVRDRAREVGRLRGSAR